MYCRQRNTGEIIIHQLTLKRYIYIRVWREKSNNFFRHINSRLPGYYNMRFFLLLFFFRSFPYRRLIHFVFSGCLFVAIKTTFIAWCAMGWMVILLITIKTCCCKIIFFSFVFDIEDFKVINSILFFK